MQYLAFAILLFSCPVGDFKDIEGMSDDDNYDKPEIVNFNFTSPYASGTISGDYIYVTVPYGTDVTTLVPLINYTGKSITPPSGAAQDFSLPVNYTVTAEDSSQRTYTVTVTVASATAKEITYFAITSPYAVGTIAGTNIDITVPFGTPVTSLATDIIHTGVSISPLSGSVQDFTSPVTYTVIDTELYSHSYGCARQCKGDYGF